MTKFKYAIEREAERPHDDERPSTGHRHTYTVPLEPRCSCKSTCHLIQYKMHLEYRQGRRTSWYHGYNISNVGDPRWLGILSGSFAKVFPISDGSKSIRCEVNTVREETRFSLLSVHKELRYCSWYTCDMFHAIGPFAVLPSA